MGKTKNIEHKKRIKKISRIVKSLIINSFQSTVANTASVNAKPRCNCRLIDLSIIVKACGYDSSVYSFSWCDRRVGEGTHLC